ncbi:MAG TPA: hypothetical protein VKX17_23600 [Planctomycetota bacterium]|nr:hypothetical protein [Planctomycetota bacterium]
MKENSIAPLSENKKAAYRGLLYHAMLDIRNLCQSRGKASYNPFEWKRQYRSSRVAGAIADWLHNLAKFSAEDFEGFDEDWFWREFELFRERKNLFDYRRIFNDELARSLACDAKR